MTHRFFRALGRILAVPVLAALAVPFEGVAMASDGGGGTCVAVDTACTADDTCCVGTCGAFGADGSLICGSAPEVCLAVGAKCGGAGADASCGCSGETCVDGGCATVTASDDGGFVAHGCIANGEPCSAGEKCCVADAYCGSFGGTGNARVCGVDTTDAIPTSSCGVGGGGVTDAVWVVAGLVIVVGVRRKRGARAVRIG